MNILNIDGVSLIGFRINPDSEKPEVYTLITYGADEIILNENDELIFFTELNQSRYAFSFFADSIQSKFTPPIEIDIICDLALALHIIAHKDIDESSVILNCLNTAFDLMKAAKINMSDARKKVLYSLADYLTFNQNYLEFLNSQDISRDEILDSLTWCIGSVLTRIRFLTATQIKIDRQL